MVDQMVLEAQKWVNSTYSKVPGYQPVKESGVTGWSTMHSLIMGLQHELGIKNLAAAFGPTTQRLFTSSGGLKINENNNKVKILQAALYCKGYSPGGITGKYGPGTAAALGQLANDLGITSSNQVTSVSTKLMQALLTMDAYKLLAGGRPSVRSFQQHLNRTYAHRKNFAYVPCDGLYSRNTQKALVMALQFEMGISDDLATGFFGPATRDGLRKIGLGLSAWSKPGYVALFTGALAANGFGMFSTVEYEELAKHIKYFQEASELPVTRRPDYVTWCELLVSMGDPNRKVDTVDTRFEITDKWAEHLKSIGVKYIARYLDEYDPHPNQNEWFKQLRPQEPQRILNHGFKLILFSQLTTGSSESVKGSRGYDHAVKTHATAKRHGIPAGATIYFAIDFDATDADIDNLVLPYFRLVADYMSRQTPRYAVGVYGTRNVCQRVVQSGLAARSYISGISYGWSGNLGFPLPAAWAFNQIATRYPEGKSDGFAYDAVVRRTKENYVDMGVDSLVTNTLEANSKFFSYMDDVYKVITDLKISNPEVMLFNYMRFGGYNGFEWNVFLGDEPSSDFKRITDAVINKYRDKYSVSNLKDGRTTVLPPEVFDYRTGGYIDAKHLAAVMMGVYKRFEKDYGKNLSVYAGEYTGWAGDLVTLYGEYNRSEDSYADPKVFIDEYFGNFSNSSFKYSDLLEDSLGYIAGRALSERGKSARSELRRMLSSGYSGRVISEFYKLRFKGSREFLENEMLNYLGVNVAENRPLVSGLLLFFNLPVYNMHAESKVVEFSNYLSLKIEGVANS